MEENSSISKDEGGKSNSYEEEALPEATKEQAKGIKAIDRTTVHQICSGQVVLNLATAVKELVENSLDAGATHVEVKLKDHGATLIEVTDNGSGVEEANFQGLTLKHHTSKLREFQDLVAVETFGFRGEALSSLCALAKVSISTRHISTQLGSNIDYDHNGKILKIEKSARSVGTTVSLKDIFSTMPVRVKEFQRNIKKEFAKLCQVLNAYCLVSTGVRLQCVNIVKGKRTVVLSTKGEKSVRDNIISIFGSKQAASVREIKQQDLSEEELVEIGIRSGLQPDVKLTGYISSCNYGEGRGACDRQYYFINNRPCDPSKISKVINEVYHVYNRSQNPFVYLNIVTQRTTVDVNITPDKRQVFLQNEKYLCSLIRKSLEAMYKDTPRDIVVNLQSGPLVKEANVMQGSATSSIHEKVSLSNLKRKFNADNASFVEEAKSKQIKIQPKMDSFFSKLPKSTEDKENEKSYTLNKNLINSSGDGADYKQIETDKLQSNPANDVDVDARPDVSISFESFESLSQSDLKSKTVQNLPDTDLKITFEDSNSLSQPGRVSSEGTKVGKGFDIVFDDAESLSQVNDRDNNGQGKEKSRGMGVEITFDDAQSLSQLPSTQKADTSIPDNIKLDTFDKNMGIQISFDDIQSLSQSETNNEEENEKEKNLEEPKVTPIKVNEDKNVKISVVDTSSKANSRKQVQIDFSMDHLKQSLDNLKVVDQKEQNELKFSAKISPQDNQNAEKELMRQLSKPDFAKMDIYGQFNLGFIIAGLDKDIFIIDQHATDEKYNFERLQETTVISSQPMVTPQHLELTAVNENILMENLDVFLKNGFKFQIDETAAATQRVKLSHLPISKNWSFGKPDIDELIFMLSESAEGSVLRPSRVRAMFASRACRSSYMIGTSLSKVEMRRLVDHMGQIEQPWNCPHGRPTIRHLVNSSLLD